MPTAQNVHGATSVGFLRPGKGRPLMTFGLPARVRHSSQQPRFLPMYCVRMYLTRRVRRVINRHEPHPGSGELGSILPSGSACQVRSARLRMPPLKPCGVPPEDLANQKHGGNAWPSARSGQPKKPILFLSVDANRLSPLQVEEEVFPSTFTVRPVNGTLLKPRLANYP
jgi:hypothetical protein